MIRPKTLSAFESFRIPNGDFLKMLRKSVEFRKYDTSWKAESTDDMTTFAEEKHVSTHRKNYLGFFN